MPQVCESPYTKPSGRIHDVGYSHKWKHRYGLWVDANDIEYRRENFRIKTGHERVASGESIEARFLRLLKVWNEETEHLSLIRDKVANHAYLSIIGMGPHVVPLIIMELRDRPSHWFAALRALTGADPASDAKSPREARDKWLSWAQESGLI